MAFLLPEVAAGALEAGGAEAGGAALGGEALSEEAPSVGAQSAGAGRDYNDSPISKVTGSIRNSLAVNDVTHALRGGGGQQQPAQQAGPSTEGGNIGSWSNVG